MSLLDSFLLRALPRASWGDRIIHRRGFRRSLGRLPSPGGGMNDAIYFLMTGPEALNPLRVRVTDKEHVKDYVREKIGDKYNVPTVAVLKSMQEVRAYSFPDHCVVKPTHLSARLMFTPPNGTLNYPEIEDWFATNYYRWTREPFYKALEPKVIVEPVLFGTTNIRDYKFMCVNGDPRMVWVDSDRRIGHKRNFYLPDWTPLPSIALGCPRGIETPKPGNLDEMLQVAATVSADFSLIRVDLYSDGESCYVGELTNSSGAGREPFLGGENRVTEILFGRESSLH